MEDKVSTYNRGLILVYCMIKRKMLNMRLLHSISFCWKKLFCTQTSASAKDAQKKTSFIYDSPFKKCCHPLFQDDINLQNQLSVNLTAWH